MSVSQEHIVPMEILSQRLRERAKQLGISNAEAARRIGLDERRYAHYASGRREPDLATLVRIANDLGTTPNWLLGVLPKDERDKVKSDLIERFENAATGMTTDELELCIIQAEALSARSREKGSP